jgi:Leucine-rich repeat (LRR) protein
VLFISVVLVPRSFPLNLFVGLDENTLTGSIPASLGRCQNLQSLFLQKNSFTGITFLKENFPISSISIQGPIDFLGTLTNLQIGYLSHNKFTGSIPQGLTAITSLQQIGMG